MPPQGKAKAKAKAKGKAKAQAKAAAAANSTELTLELGPGQKDNANLDFLAQLNDAVEVVKDYYGADIITPMPLKLARGGLQEPYCQTKFAHVFSLDENAVYTCGINLLWIDFLWSPVPGVPARLSAIAHMKDKFFNKPCPFEGLHVAAPDATFNPSASMGSLMRVSPEELTGAYLMAIARDVKNEESAPVLDLWKKYLLSTTCGFKILPTQTDRYWYALAQRETVEMTYLVVRRSCYQRIHEVIRFIEKCGR